LIIPAAFIGYGVAGLAMDKSEAINNTRTEINEHQPARTNLIIILSMPGQWYTGSMAGIKGKHNLRDRTIIYASSQLIVAAFTMP
jgi:hypothetical protein